MEKQTLIGGKLEFKLAPSGADTAEKTLGGCGAVFNNTDHARDVIAPGAFAATLAEHKAAGTLPSMFFNHAMFDMPIGVWTSMEEDDHGLKVAGVFIDTSAGRDAYAAVKAGAVTGLSIGYIATDYVILNDIRTITEAKLLEVSIVTFPCNAEARVTDIKSQENTMKERKSADALAALKLAQDALDKAKALFADDLPDDAESDGSDEENSDEATADDTAEEKFARDFLEAIRTASSIVSRLNPAEGDQTK